MTRTIFSFICATFLLATTLVVLQAKSEPDSPTIPNSYDNALVENGVSIIRADESGLSLILNSDELEFSADGELTSQGLTALTTEPGTPALPYFSTYIAIPPEAEVTITVQQKGVQTLTNMVVTAIPEPTMASVNADFDSALSITAVSPQTTSIIPNPTIYAQDALYPSQLYQLSAPIYARDMRLVKLDLYPVQYNPLRQEIRHASQIQVDLQFEGAQLKNLHPAPSVGDAQQNNLSGLVLNFEQGKAWRSLPLPTQDKENNVAETAVSLPLGSESYKIGITQDGIYDISGADLEAAGMIIGNINPSTLEMMTRGNTVAFQFIKNGTNNTIVESDDIIRFYGEGVNGPRREKQFLDYNVYWLWPNGTATPLANIDNTPSGTPISTFTDSITREDELYLSFTRTNEWYRFPNDPDSWYWYYLKSPNPKTLTVDLPDPVLDEQQSATYTIELLSDEKYYNGFDYQLDTCVNSHPTCGQGTWHGLENVNITQTVPMTAFVADINNFILTLSNPVDLSQQVKAYVNRITVEYVRHLKAENDQLFFTDDIGGQTLAIQDFSTDALNDMLIWDISNPTTPTALGLDASDVSEENGRYTYTLSIDSNSPQTYIATTITNTQSPAILTKYVAPTNLEPTNGADWIAISYGDFLPQANSLATHRQQAPYGEFATHVVDIEDIINVYGYGLPMTDATQTYLYNALTTWNTPPSFVMLLGDGVITPRIMACDPTCGPSWLEPNQPNLVPTDMQFQDRFQGLIASDNTMVFLVGTDLLADMAIGRLPAETAAQATSMVNKIIKFEETLHTPEQASNRILFVADKPDPGAGGDFCDTNQNITGPLLPNSYDQVHLCYQDGDISTDFLDEITAETSEGVLLMNYRGHGEVQGWGSPLFWDTGSAYTDQHLKNTWANEGKPVAILSADCLDGYFALPGLPALSERFLKLDQLAGSVAHWSSSGLGYDYEHTTLLEGFYIGLFDYNKATIGEAVNYAKEYFSLSPSYSESEMYSFNLQGDPAMQLVIVEHSIFLPMIQR